MRGRRQLDVYVRIHVAPIFPPMGAEVLRRRYSENGHRNRETPHEPSHGSRLQQRGRASRLARALGRPEETVSDWANDKSLVDPELVVEIERITGMSRHKLSYGQT